MWNVKTNIRVKPTRFRSIVGSLYLRIFKASFFITFQVMKIATYTQIHTHFSLSRIVLCVFVRVGSVGLFLGMVLSVYC